MEGLTCCVCPANPVGHVLSSSPLCTHERSHNQHLAKWEHLESYIDVSKRKRSREQQHIILGGKGGYDSKRE